MTFTPEQYKVYTEAFLKAFPDSKDIPRMDDGDIDVMVLQEWARKHGMSLVCFYMLVELAMAQPDLDKDIYFAAMTDFINRETKGRI